LPTRNSIVQQGPRPLGGGQLTTLLTLFAGTLGKMGKMGGEGRRTHKRHFEMLMKLPFKAEVASCQLKNEEHQQQQQLKMSSSGILFYSFLLN